MEAMLEKTFNVHVMLYILNLLGGCKCKIYKSNYHVNFAFTPIQKFQNLQHDMSTIL